MSNDMRKDVAFIKEWMAKEHYLPQDLDEGMIEKFLHSCRGSLERTKKCIDRFCSTRSQMTELYSGRDPFADNVKTAFSVTRVCSYKADDYEILVHHYDDPELEHFSFYDILKTLTMQADYWIKFHNQFPEGHIIILDMSSFSLRMIPRVNVMFFRDFLLFLLEGLPVRVTKVYAVNAPSYYDKMYSLVKPVLPAELCSIIHFFHDYETLHQHIDKKFLPVEYGGDASSTKIKNEDWINKIKEHRKILGMEDQPSTSKDATNRNDPDEEKDEESRDDQGTNSGTTLSNYSDKSLLHMAATGIEKPKPVLGKPDAKFDDKKRKKRRIGRVEKQRKQLTRRQVVRRAPKRKPRVKYDKRRDLSVSTMYSRLSSSGLLTPACERCGHRCCRRRYEFELRRQRKARKNHYVRRMLRSPVYMSENIQVGSCSKMLSPLFINTNSVQFEEKPPMMYSEISPEMIYESLRRLTMWKQNVETSEILKYVQRNYPVNPDPDILLMELLQKLSIAAIVGIVSQTSNDTWSLSCALERRKLNKTHVTLFWKLYGDTMRPIAKKQNGNPDSENVNNQEKVLRIYNYEIL